MQRAYILHKIVFLITIFSTYYNTNMAQVNWEVYSQYPVLSMDSLFRWEVMGQPTCIMENDTIKMWFANAWVKAGDPYFKARIHYAYSVDGISWTRDTVPAIDVGAPGEWDDEWLDTPEIVKDATGYKMYYYGDSTYFQGQDNTAIGLATSTDGKNWTKQGIVFTKGNPGDWDGQWVESPALYFDLESGLHAMWYSGVNAAGLGQTGLAVSDDGIAWNRLPQNPIIPAGAYPSWKDFVAGVPSVIKTDNLFEMWYSGIHYDDDDSVSVGYAVSLDGVNWLDYPGNPVLGRSTPDDTTKFWAVDVVWDETHGDYKMFYESAYKFGTQAIYLATGSRDVLFAEDCQTQVTKDTSITKGESLQLNASDGLYYHWLPDTFLSDNKLPNPICTPDTSLSYKVLIVGETCITVDSVTIRVNEPSYRDNLQTILNCRLYPNPSSGVIHFNSPEEIIKAEVFSVYGQKIGHYNLDNNLNQMNLENFSNGIYFIRLHTKEKKQGVFKIILQ